MIERAWSPIDYTDYTSTDQTWQVKQAQMQGATMESVYWFQMDEKFMKFIHETKTNKTRTK